MYKSTSKMLCNNYFIFTFNVYSKIMNEDFKECLKGFATMVCTFLGLAFIWAMVSV